MEMFGYQLNKKNIVNLIQLKYHMILLKLNIHIQYHFFILNEVAERLLYDKMKFVVATNNYEN